MAMKSSRAVHLCFQWLLVLSTVLLQTSDGHSLKKHQLQTPCRNLVLHFHDVRYDGSNAHNATSTLVGAPQGANLTTLTGNNHFGDMVVFDDPITLDNNFHSPPVGRAQGFYFYDMKNTFSAWFGFTFVLNSTDYKGTITFAGADLAFIKYRDISVVGGTGDFLMARGIATISTDAYEDDVYFRLRVNITLYECYF